MQRQWLFYFDFYFSLIFHPKKLLLQSKCLCGEGFKNETEKERNVETSKSDQSLPKIAVKKVMWANEEEG